MIKSKYVSIILAFACWARGKTRRIMSCRNYGKRKIKGAFLVAFLFLLCLCSIIDVAPPLKDFNPDNLMSAMGFEILVKKFKCHGIYMDPDIGHMYVLVKRENKSDSEIQLYKEVELFLMTSGWINVSDGFALNSQKGIAHLKMDAVDFNTILLGFGRYGLESSKKYNRKYNKILEELSQNNSNYTY